MQSKGKPAPRPPPSLSFSRCNEVWELWTGLYMLDAWEKTLFVRACSHCAAPFRLSFQRPAPPRHHAPAPAEQSPRHLLQRLRVLLSARVFARLVSARSERAAPKRVPGRGITLVPRPGTARDLPGTPFTRTRARASVAFFLATWLLFRFLLLLVFCRYLLCIVLM